MTTRNAIRVLKWGRWESHPRGGAIEAAVNGGYNIMRVLLFFVVGIPIAFAATIFLASELGGEVVELHTVDASGDFHSTSLWIVDEGGYSYLRAGDRAASWFSNIERQPVVDIERGGEMMRFTAVPVPRQTSEIDALMARDYGLADRLVAMMRDPSKSVAIRLVPAD